MATLFSDNFNRADSATVDATNWTETITSVWSILSNRLRAVTTGGLGRCCVTTTSAHAAVADCAVQVDRVARSGSFDSGLMVRTNGTGTTGYFLDCIGTGAGATLDIWRIDGPAISNDTQIGSTVTGLTIAATDTLKFQVQTVGATVELKGYVNGVQRISVVDSSGSRITTAGQTGIIKWDTSDNDYDNFIVTDLSTTATLSSPTPSGTLGTTTTATIGATTDQTSGTFYAVVDSAANLSGVTATQIKAGQKASGAAALASGSSAVSTTAPAANVTGLSPTTLYSYAAVQNNGSDSNVVTGTFTTATAAVSLEISKYGPQGAARVIVTF